MMPIFLMFLKSYWKYIAVFTAVVAGYLFIWNQGAESARKDCEAEKEAYRAELQAEFDKISKMYEEDSIKREETNDVINTELEAEIASQPLYYNIVIPERGLQLFRQSVAGIRAR